MCRYVSRLTMLGAAVCSRRIAALAVAVARPGIPHQLVCLVPLRTNLSCNVMQKK